MHSLTLSQSSVQLVEATLPKTSVFGLLLNADRGALKSGS
jgi:hypothetical protein